jgi:hypothetical protein
MRYPSLTLRVSVGLRLRTGGDKRGVSAKVELGDHQRFTLIWTILSSLIMLAVGMAATVIPLAGHAR